MSVIGIQYLKGINEMPKEDLTALFQAYPELRRKSNKEIEQVYKDQQFIAKYGETVFQQIPDAGQRDKKYNDDALNDVWNTRYGNDLDDFKSITTPEARKYILESGYLTTKERAALDEQDQIKLQNDIDNYKKSKENQIFHNPRVGYFEEQQFAEEGLNTSYANKVAKRNKENEKILLKAKDLDNNSILQDEEVVQYKGNIIQGIQQQINNNENGASEIDKQITDLLLTRDEVSGQPLFNYFAAYHDKKELENLSLNKKIDLYADLQSIIAKAETIKDPQQKEQYYIKAIDIVNEKLQNEIHNNRNGWKRAWINTTMIGTKAWASVGNTYTGLIAEGLYMKGLLSDDYTEYYNYLKGQDINGEALPWYNSLNYFSDVDKYNRFDTSEILKAKQNGGLSTRSHVSEYGKEFDFWTKETWGEGVGMVGYMLPSLAVDFALTKGRATVGKLMTKGALKVLPKTAVKSITKAVSNDVTKIIGDAARLWVHASPEGTMEGKNNFDIVYEKAKQDFYNSPEVITAMEQEVQKRINELYPNGIPDVLVPVLDSEGQDTGARTNTAVDIENNIRQQVLEEFSQKGEQVALEAASKAFQSTYYSFLIKNSITDLAFQSYTFAGRTPFSTGKNPKIRFNYDGTAKSLAPTIWDITKAVVKPSIGGFIEEFTDEMANIGSQELGFNYVDNYINHYYKGDLEPYFDKSLGAAQAYIQGATKAMYEESTWHQAFIGAISPFTTAMPNIGGMVKRSQMSKEQLEKLNAIEKINQFVFNPLIGNIASEYEESRQAESTALLYNKLATQYKDNFTKPLHTLDLINELEQGKASGDPRKQKDAEHKLGFNFVSDLYEMAQQGDENNLASKYLETLQRLSRGEVSAEEMSEFQEKVENRDRYEGAGGKRAATKVIQSNAKKLYELFEDYQSTRNMLENAYGNTLSSEAIQELTFKSMLSPHWENRKSQMERELGITTSKSLVRGRKTRRGLERELQITEKNISAAESISTKYTSKKKALSNIIKKLKNKHAIIQDEIKRGTPNQALTVDEILNASAIERYNMFENKNDYSQEQQEIIEEAEKVLQEKHPDWRTKLKDIAELERDIEQNRDLFNALVKNPKDLESYIQYLHESYLNNLLDSYINQHVDELEIQLDQHEVGSSEWHATINKYGKGVITALKNQYEKEGKMTDSLRKSLNKAEKLSGLVSDVHNIIQQSQLPKEVKRNLTENILAIINDASSYSKAINSLQNALENPDIAEDVKSYIRTILEKVGAIEKQRKSTKNKNKTQEVEVIEEQEVSLDDDSPKDSQEFVLTKTEDIDLEEQGSVEEELPENNQESEQTSVDLENFTLFGNSMLGYMLDKLREGILNFTRGKIENDLKSTYFKWLESINVFPQRIVDYELSALKALNVPVQTVLLKLPEEGANSPMNNVASTVVLLVVKADDRVKKIHNNALSDYIIIKGEQYLVLGNLGYKNGDSTQRTIFRKLQDKAKIARKEYFDKEENKNEEFFLIPDYTLSIGNITSGHLVHQTENDTQKKQRSISELLNDSQRNPRQIGWNDLIWIIPTETGFKANKNVAVAKGEMPGRVGHLFLAIKDTRGKYIPIQMKTYVSEDIKEGAFKNKILQQINNILDGITQRDHDKRLTAVKELSKYLLFRQNGDNILIGTNQNHTISVKVDGMQYDFTEQDVANNRQQVIDRILGNADKGIPGKFHIVYTESTITNVDRMKELDEAGVLTTDAAVLGTAGGQFSVVNGTSTQEESSNENQETLNNKPEYPKRESVLLNGKTFRFTDGRYVDENGQTIIDQDTLDKINIVNQCAQMKVSLVERGNFYYILNSDVNNLKIVALFGKSNNLRVCSQQESLAVIHKIQEKNMAENIKNSSEDIDIDIQNETNSQNTLQNNQEKIEKNKEPIKKQDVFDKNFGKNLQDSKNNYTFAEISRNPQYRSKIYTLLKDKFGEEYTKAADKEAFLRSKGITTTSIQDVEAWMEHIKNCK